MGRPVNKRYFGVLTGSSNNNIPVEGAFIDGVATFSAPAAEIFIVKQKSARRFLVQSATSGDQALCRLVDKAGAGDDSTAFGLTAGEMVIVGYVDGAVNNVVTIRSLTNKIATDFNSVRYKWSVEDDSTTTQLILTRM
jgi:hypothetical protein